MVFDVQTSNEIDYSYSEQKCKRSPGFLLSRLLIGHLEWRHLPASAKYRVECSEGLLKTVYSQIEQNWQTLPNLEGLPKCKSKRLIGCTLLADRGMPRAIRGMPICTRFISGGCARIKSAYAGSPEENWSGHSFSRCTRSSLYSHAPNRCTGHMTV